MQRTQSLNHPLEALKDLMSRELKNCNVSDDSEQLMIGKRIVCPNVIMNERHKMARNRLKQVKTKLFPTPSELKFVTAKKAIREEQSKTLLREKQKRIVSRAIIQLEREFSYRRNSIALSLPELEKQKKEMIHSNVHEIKDKKNYTNPSDFLTDIQKAYEKLHRNISRSRYCERSISEKQQTTSQTKTDEYIEKLSPITTTEKVRTNDTNKNFERLSPITQTGNENNAIEKIKKAEFILKADNYQCETTDEVQVQQLDVKIPDVSCDEKVGNGTEQVHKWKMLYYWRVWKKMTQKARKENHKQSRIEKIDSFLMRLTEAAEQVQQLEKLANSVNSQSSQKKTISQAKKRKKSVSESKETQKLDKIEKELTESAVEAYERLNKSLKMFHPKLQPRLKALSVLSTVKNKYRSVRTETRIYPKPAFLTQMEDRYKERKTRWENIRKKRLEMEAEKERIMKEREEEEKKLEDLRKREKLEELKEKRRREKEAEEERKRERKLLKEQLKKAQDHYTRYLMKKVGFQTWQHLVQLRRSQTESADHHSQIRTCTIHLNHWRKLTALRIDQRFKKAQEFYENMLLKKGLNSWISGHDEYVQKIQVALDWSEAKLAEKAFTIWFDNAQAERWYFMRKTEFAVSLYDRKILGEYLKKWRQFPALMRNEKEKEKRRKIWQRKVQEFLPDYQPAFISEI